MPVIKNPKADIRAKYNLYLKLSFIVSISLTIAAFKFSPRGEVIHKSINLNPDSILVIPTDNTVQKKEPLKPPERPEIIVADIDDVPDDIFLPDNDLHQNDEVGPVPDRPVLHKVDDSDEPFVPFPEVYPEPIGGLKSIWEKVHYTDIAIRAEITGTVIIEAAIDKKGNVIDAKVLKSLGFGLDEISLNAVKQTKFKPGMQHGRPVKVKMTIPIKFVLR